MHTFCDTSSSPGKSSTIKFPVSGGPFRSFPELELLHKELDDFLQSIGDQGYVISRETVNEHLSHQPDQPPSLRDIADNLPAELEGSKPPEVNYATKPTTLTEQKQRSEKRVAASTAWKQLGSSAYYFVDKSRAVQK